MVPHNVTDGTSQPLTAAGAAAPAAGLDISGMSGAYMLEVEVTSLTAATGTPRARIVFEDSDQPLFADAVPVAEFTFSGPIVAGVPVKLSTMSYQSGGLRIGTAGAMLRANVVALDGDTPSLKFRAALHN